MTYELDRSHNIGEEEREARLRDTTRTSVAVEWGRGIWWMLTEYELDEAGFHDAVAYNVPGTDLRRFELMGPDSPGEYIYEFDRKYLAKHAIGDLVTHVIWFIRIAAARQGKDYRAWDLGLLQCEDH